MRRALWLVPVAGACVLAGLALLLRPTSVPARATSLSWRPPAGDRLIVPGGEGRGKAHTLGVVHPSHLQLGIEPDFWQDEAKDGAAVLPLVRPV